MRAMINLLVSVCFFFALGCDNPTEPPDTPEPANRYELLYVYPNEIHAIMSNGENHRQITQNNDYDHEPIWSPDQTRIAYVADADQDGSNETIFMVELATKAKVELTRGWTSPGWH